MAYNAKIQAFYQDTLEGLKNSGLYKVERILHDIQKAEINVEFPAGSEGKKVINLCSNNYLGLSNHPHVIQAAERALHERGYGLSSVRFICGTQDIHIELERRMSAFLEMEDTILFGSCFDANGAVFEALLDENDIMISDRLVHASIIDGMRLSKAQHDTYKHSDMEHLRKKLEQYKDYPKKVIITDGVFSMDGDIAKLDKIVALAEEFDALVFVDDSHATGFIGESGKGTHEYCNVMGKVDIITTTFGKALGGASGGCISARKEMVELLRQKARPYLFSNSLSPIITYTTLAVLDLLESNDNLRKKLNENRLYWRKGLQEIGFLMKEGDSPIIPVMLFNAKLAQEVAKDLYQEGVFVVGFFFPVVAQGQARIRTQLSAGLERRDLDYALQSFKKIGDKYGILGLTKEELIEKYGL